MAKRQVELILAAKDTTSKSFDRVNKNITVLEKHTRRIKAMGNIFSGFIAGAAVIQSFRAVINATREQESALAQLDARLKSTEGAAGKTSEELQDTAAALQKVTTFGDEAIISMQSLLLSFTNIKSDKFDEATTAVLDLSVAMKTDLKSSAIQIGKALNDPIKGLSALTRNGVIFTDSQKDLIKSLQDTGDLAGAQAIILKELQTEFGGSAKAAADTFGGALAQLSNAFGDLLEADGKGLTGAKNELKELTALLQDPKTKEAFQNLTAGAISFAGALSSIAVGFNDFGVFFGETLAQGALKFQGVSDDVVYFEKTLHDLNEQTKETGLGIESTADTVERLGREADATRDLLAELGGVQVAGGEFSENIERQIEKLEEERKILKLSAKERFIYNQIKKAGTDATYEEINAIKNVSEALFEEKEAIKTAKTETKQLDTATKEYKKTSDSVSSSATSSAFGKEAKDVEELTEKTEEATKAKKEWLSASSQGGKDTSDAFDTKTTGPIDLTPERAAQKAREIKTAMQNEFDTNPVQVKVVTQAPKTIRKRQDPSVSSSFSEIGGLNSGLSSVSISRQALKEGIKQ